MKGKIAQATRNRIYALSLKFWTPQEISHEVEHSVSQVKKYMAPSARMKRSTRRI